MIDTLRLGAEEAMGLLERGEVSAAELRSAYREAIDARNQELNCFLTLVDDDENQGVPIALKDVISTKGVRTTAGSKILESYVPVFDSTVAARCKAAGLQLLGKTNTDEFAMGSSTENSAYGPTRNPWDLARVPGGSGGGSAAAVAAGLAPWALGSDTGGSIKQPAALCGNVGLRPTYGTVSRYGIVAFASSLDQVGPVSRTVRDNALLYGVISGRDENDSTTVVVPPVELPAAEDLKGLRVGVPKELNEAEGIESGVTEAVRKTIDLCAELGADVGECELPRSVEYGLACYYLIAPAEASSNLARYDGVRYGLRVPADNYYEMVARTRDAGFGEEADHARYVRALGRLLRGVLRPGAEGPHGDRARVRRGVRALRRAREPDVADRRLPHRREGGEPAGDVPRGRSDDSAEHGRPPGPLDSVWSLRRSSRRAAAHRPAVLGEHSLPRRPRARAGDRIRSRSGAVAMKTIVDRAADFVLAVERVFGVRPRVLDGSRAVQIDDVRLSLEAGERELCVIRMHGALAEYVAVLEVGGDIEVSLLEAKEVLHA
jgi:aspartyl-tRNA(Asn)/glutamyl-tRNA(Gln) amidotransferase subunit A